MKAKASRGAAAPGRNVVRANLRLDAEAYERLLIHSIKGKEQAGDIVSRLIREHLRQWRVQENPTTRVTSPVSAKIDGQVEETRAEAA